MENQKDHARKIALTACTATVAVASLAALLLPAEAAPLLALAIPFLGMSALDGLLSRDAEGHAGA